MTIQVHGGDVITTSGYSVHARLETRDVILTINIKTAPTGTTPGIVFTLQEVDPGDYQTGVGTPISTAVLSAVGYTTLSLRTKTGAVKVSWTVTGTSPVFPKIHTTLVSKTSEGIAGYKINGDPQPILVDDVGRIYLAPTTDWPLTVRNQEEPTYSVSALSVILGNNKSLISIHNAHVSSVYKIHQIWLINALTTAVTGLVCTFDVKRLAGTAPTGGTDLSTSGVEAYDANDAAPPLTNFTVRTGATVAGKSTKLLYRALWSSDEWGSGSSDVESHAHTQQTLMPLWSKAPGTKPIILRQNQGITIDCATNTFLGVWDIFATVSLAS